MSAPRTRHHIWPCVGRHITWVPDHRARRAPILILPTNPNDAVYRKFLNEDACYHVADILRLMFKTDPCDLIALPACATEMFELSLLTRVPSTNWRVFGIRRRGNTDLHAHTTYVVSSGEEPPDGNELTAYCYVHWNISDQIARAGAQLALTAFFACAVPHGLRWAALRPDLRQVIAAVDEVLQHTQVAPWGGDFSPDLYDAGVQTPGPEAPWITVPTVYVDEDAEDTVPTVRIREDAEEIHYVPDDPWSYSESTPGAASSGSAAGPPGPPRSPSPAATRNKISAPGGWLPATEPPPPS